LVGLLVFLEVLFEPVDVAQQFRVHLKFLVCNLLCCCQVALHIIALFVEHGVFQLCYQFSFDGDQIGFLFHALQVVVQHLFFSVQSFNFFGLFKLFFTLSIEGFVDCLLFLDVLKLDWLVDWCLIKSVLFIRRNVLLLQNVRATGRDDLVVLVHFVEQSLLTLSHGCLLLVALQDGALARLGTEFVFLLGNCTVL
jgi:hypothetical protein